MRRECRERFPRHRLQRKPLINDPDIHHGTCMTQVPWCMSGSLTRGGGENVPGIPGACATHNFTYLAKGPWKVRNYASMNGRYLSINVQITLAFLLDANIMALVSNGISQNMGCDYLSMPYYQIGYINNRNTRNDTQRHQICWHKEPLW